MLLFSDEMKTAAHIIVQGLVQGVGFRWYVLQQARNLGINGYVRNLYNGKVEIEAEGDRGLLDEFIKSIRIGPRASHVHELQLTWASCSDSYQQFEIR